MEPGVKVTLDRLGELAALDVMMSRAAVGLLKA